MNESQYLCVDVEQQQLKLMVGDQALSRYAVSTAKNGIGQLFGSECTPLGEHRIKLCIGDGCPANTVFVARRATGEIYDSALACQYPERDWVLTRIIWLTGVESGKNRGGNCDTLRRFIYIHGCPDHEPMGIPISHGCIRMTNNDIMDLFAKVHNGMKVVIC